MNLAFRRIERGLRALALVVVAAACMDQDDLFGPGEDGPPRVRLVAAAYELHAGDRVALSIENLRGRRGTAELLVQDTAGAIVWRSATAPVEEAVSQVLVAGIPDSIIGVSGLSLTASVETGGVRVYASDDSAAAMSRGEAAVRPARFLAGEAVGLDAGRIGSLALDAATGRIYFSAPDRARIEVFDVSAGADLGGTAVPSGPVSLRFFGGRLGALMADGTELGVFEGGADLVLRERILLPTLRMEVQTLRAPADSSGPAEVDTLTGTVRPYARAFAWGCLEPSCAASVVLAGSELSAADAGEGAAGIRRVGVAGAAIEPLLVPRFQPGVLPTDTIASRVRVFATASGGADSLVADRSDRMRCPSVALDGRVFDVSRASPTVIYAATAGSGCGEGTRILRVDNAGGVDPQVSALARRNLLGEDRIGEVAELRVSPDGQFVLVRADDRIHLFDAELRLRATIPLPGVSAVAWVEGQGPSEYFVAASPLGISLYDTSRRVQLASIPVGLSRENLAVGWRSEGHLIVVVGPRDRDGLVIVRVPLP